MFGDIKDFYPTPRALIEKMVEGLSFSGKSILEPSAGKGDICDYIRKKNERDYYNNRSLDIDVIEINEDLQHILKGKEYKLVHDDFLSFRTNKRYELIVANFPFSTGDEHLKKALELLDSSGGDLVCLVNAETIRNPCTKLRETLAARLDKLEAQIEFLTGEFTYAERKTDVYVALVRVKGQERELDSVILETLKRAREVEADASDEPQALVEQNYVSQIVANFDVECDLGIKLIKEWFLLKPFIKNGFVKSGERDYTRPLIELKIDDSYSSDSKSDLINRYLKKARRKYWGVLVSDLRFAGKYTSNILEALNAKLNELENYDFTAFNIRELEKELATKITDGIKDAILSMFDEFSTRYAYFDYSQNIHYYNGWKTNKAHKINHKIILPINGFSSYSYNRNKLDDHYIQKRFADMIKVFNYLSEYQVSTHQLVGNQFHIANESQKFTNIDLRYFDVTFYKKGTCHIKFKDLKLLEKFNIYGSQKKGWLPPSYGKVKYEDLDLESKSVIDEFQGRDLYEQIVKDADFYLSAPGEKSELTNDVKPLRALPQAVVQESLF